VADPVHDPRPRAVETYVILVERILKSVFEECAVVEFCQSYKPVFSKQPTPVWIVRALIEAGQAQLKKYKSKTKRYNNIYNE
jgi:hypothetical protein